MTDKVLVKQNTPRPTRKLTNTAIGGAMAAVVMGGVNAYNPELYQGLMQPGFEAGAAVMFAWFVGYMSREYA